MEGTGGVEWTGGGSPERSHLRVSDEDRHAVSEVLREAAGEGRLTLEELEQRLEDAYAARTYADLEPLTLDLPTLRESSRLVPASERAPSRQVPPGTGEVRSLSLAVMSGTRRRGPWRPGDSHTAVAVMGSVELDLRDAELPAELVVTAVALMGSVSVTVDPQTRVVVEGLGLMGSFEEMTRRGVPPAPADGPVVRVRGLAVMGSVDVRRKPRR